MSRMFTAETQLRSILIRAISAATNWWLADIIAMRLSTEELIILADVELAE
jgi:hypothetical protein